MQNNPESRLPLSKELIHQSYLLNVYSLAEFLNRAMRAIQATNHEITDMERYGFDLCMGLLVDNTNNSIQAEKALQEAGNG